MKNLGERIRQLRGERNQTDFAKEFGFSLRQISAWERGESEPPVSFFAQVAEKHGSSELQFLLIGRRDDALDSLKAAVAKCPIPYDSAFSFLPKVMSKEWLRELRDTILDDPTLSDAEKVAVQKIVRDELNLRAGKK
jgi:transcriptional regulator with XRE-family HTH domain